MPTAKASITASVMENDDIDTKLEPIMTVINPMPSPITAVRIGRPAARKDVKVNAKIMNAIRIPMTSETPPTSIFDNATLPDSSV
ncbi:hypothetical protein D3C72_1064060 [compost metagenome]